MAYLLEEEQDGHHQVDNHGQDQDGNADHLPHPTDRHHEKEVLGQRRSGKPKGKDGEGKGDP